MPKTAPKTAPTDDLEAVLPRLQECGLSLASLPESLQQIAVSYAKTYDRMDELRKKFPGTVVAEALMDVWNQKVRSPLAQSGAPVESWLQALLPVAQYIAPATGLYEDPFFPEDVRTEKARYRLMSQEWLKQIVRDAGLAEEIAICASERLGKSPGRKQAGLGTPPRTYYHWMSKGQELLRKAILQTLSPAASKRDMPVEMRLPEHFVERRALENELRQIVLETVGEGGWIAVTGMSGVGKSVLLATLRRATTIRAAFGDSIAEVEVTAEMDALSVARRLAAGVGKPLPYWVEDVGQARRLLQGCTKEQPMLWVVDGVHTPAILEGVRDLQAQMVGVLATSSQDVVDMMGIPRSRQVRVGPMSPAEAWELAVRVCESIPPDEQDTVCEILRWLEYDPLDVSLTAAWARTDKDGWEGVHRWIKDEQARALVGEQWERRRDRGLEMWQRRATPEQRQCLAAIGCLPFLLWYDVETGVAVWRKNAASADVMWNVLARQHLVEYLGGGRYGVHHRVWDFARRKAWELPWWERALARCWVWRYPLRSEWSEGGWWRIKVDRPTEVEWAWWSYRVPTMQEKGRTASLWWWLTNRIWPGGLRMAAEPEEWAMTAQARGRFWSALVVAVGVALIGAPVLVKTAQTQPISWGKMMGCFGVWVGGMGLFLWVAAVALEEFRRMAWRRLREGKRGK